MCVRLLYIVFLIQPIHSSRVLSIIPIASSSHQFAFQPLWKELASRGHEVTVMTTDPQKNKSLTNLKEIDLSFSYDICEKYNFSELTTEYVDGAVDAEKKLTNLIIDVLDAQLSSPQVQDLIHDKDLQFDLVMVEVNTPSMLLLAGRFQCPVIAILSYDCSIDFHDALGNPTHPVLNPDINLNIVNAEDLTFTERLKSLIWNVLYRYMSATCLFPRMQETARQYLGNDLPPITEIQNNISMMFIATHPIFHQLRPMNLNTIPIGGMIHSKEPKPLPHELKQFLDEADDGAIFFSLGTHVKYNLLTTEFRKAIMDALAEIPFRVVIKIDGEFGSFSKNVLVKKWVPQQDILRHPNVKLFITQGGLLSLKEAVYNDIPVIGIPFIGEQRKNMDRVVKMGYGLKINRHEVSKEVLVSSINEVMMNPRYREKAKEMGTIYRDEEIPSLQRAVYWTEYVIRHKGAKHLRNPALEMPLWKYYMLDVIATLILVAILISSLFILLMAVIYRKIRKAYRKCRTVKTKLN